jgi:hypothetical protein
MAFQPEMDDLSAFEAKETSRKLPAGWLLLFWGLVVWGAWYAWTYTPAFGGWRQALDAEEGGASMGANLLATVAFTVIPTAVAIGLAVAQKRRKAGR